jgi:GMP synthase (glutamine-hydrolysing)
VKRVLVIRTGRPHPPVSARLGGFTSWFARHLAARVEVEEADARAPLPPPARYDGLLLTGSLDSVTAWSPWMEATALWALGAARSRPVLGVCFGHQLLGRALGARVERNPRGPEAGTCAVHLTEAGLADPLFAGLPRRLLVQEAHLDQVASLPPGALRLAWNDQTPMQAFAAGDAVRAVQFHPEFDAERCRAILEEERGALGLGRPEGCSRALASVRETPEAARILANWLDAYVGAGQTG